MGELWKEKTDEIFFCFLEHIEASAQPQLQEEGEDFCGSVGRCEKPSLYLTLPFIVRIETILFDIHRMFN